MTTTITGTLNKKISFNLVGKNRDGEKSTIEFSRTFEDFNSSNVSIEEYAHNQITGAVNWSNDFSRSIYTESFVTLT